MNLKNLKNLKKGFQELTPVQLSQGKIAGYVGMIIGLILACFTTFQRGSWGLGIFLAFLAWFQLMGLLGEIQQYKGLVEMQKQIPDQTTVEDFDKQLEEAEKQEEEKEQEKKEEQQELPEQEESVGEQEDTQLEEAEIKEEVNVNENQNENEQESGS